MPFVPAFVSAVGAAISIAKGVAIVAAVIGTGYYLSRQDWNEKNPEESRGEFEDTRVASINPYLNTIQEPLVPQRIIVGEATVKGAVCMARSNGPYFVKQYLLANHEIEDVTALIIDGQSYTTDDFGYVNAEPFMHDIPRQVGQEVELQERNYLRAMFRLGGQNQLVDPLVQHRFPDVPDTYRQVGHATASIEMFRGSPEFPKVREYREEHTLPPEWERQGWGNRGIDPSFRVRGLKCFDPRSSRIEWTNNAALVTAAILVNQSISNGIDYDDLDLDALKYAADLCDEGFEILPNREFPRGAIFRNYTLDGIIQTNENLNSILSRALLCSRSTCRWVNNKYILDVSHRKDTDFALGDNDFVGNVQYSLKKKISDGVNSATARYIGADGQLIDAPVITADESPSTKTGDISLSLDYTRNTYRAQRIAKQTLAELQLERRLRVTVGRIGIIFDAGDIIEINSDRMPEINGTYEMMQADMNSDATEFNLRLNEWDSGKIHDWEPGDETPDYS